MKLIANDRRPLSQEADEGLPRLETSLAVEASREAASTVLAPASTASSPPEQSLVPVDATVVAATMYSLQKGLGVNLLEIKSCSVEARRPDGSPKAPSPH